MIYHILGLLIGVTPFSYFMLTAHHQSCELQGEGWKECRHSIPSPGDRSEKPAPIPTPQPYQL